MTFREIVTELLIQDLYQCMSDEDRRLLKEYLLYLIQKSKSSNDAAEAQ